ncbi:response regulator transcription factor [Proteinivorax hydrogeniformans]|uniref:Stage 0 sporulation protein A homolog n=1 Tax=Proteinivorax hydrogeniformans TaxID=1826727 RepID=A0AAU8HV56_9FIRM
MFKVLLVDDHEMIRLGLKENLSRDSRFEVIDEACNGQEAIDKVRNNFYDIIIMDVRLPDKTGVKVCKEVLSISPDSKVIMLTAFTDDEALIEAILGGASGYLMKEVRINELIEYVVKAAKGNNVLDPKTTEKVISHMQNKSKPADQTSQLNDREISILKLVAEGKTNIDIGKELHLSEKTVRNQLSGILSKLHLKNRAQAAAFYVQEVKFKK